MRKQLNEEFKRMQLLAGLITESEYKENTNEGVRAYLGTMVNKLKKLFTGEKMKRIGGVDGLYDYYQDDEGKKWIGVQRAEYLSEPGYRQYWVQIYDMKDEQTIKKAAENFKTQNKEYSRTVADPHSGSQGDGGTFAYKGDYFPEPIKVVNKSTF